MVERGLAEEKARNEVRALFWGAGPLGLQLIGRTFDEETLLRAAFAIEEAAGFTAEAEALVKANPPGSHALEKTDCSKYEEYFARYGKGTELFKAKQRK